jgi:hypothetical protein
MRLTNMGPKHRCPHCGRNLDQLEDQQGRPIKPGRGDLLVCYGCARPSVFAGVFRPELPAETVRHLRHGEHVQFWAETMFRDDPEFVARMAAIEALMVGSS